MDGNPQIIPYAPASKPRRRWRGWLTGAVFVFYLAGYAAYRTGGAVKPAYVCGRGAAVLMVDTGFPGGTALCRIYRPCLAAEEYCYQLAAVP